MSGYIDVHGHLGHYGPFHVPASESADLVRRMDSLGVERLLLAGNAAFSSDYRWGNRAAAAAAEAHPGRIHFYAVANPNYPAEIGEELTRLADRPGFAGLKLHPAVHEHPLEDPGYVPAWEWAERRGCPVLVHFLLGDGRCGADNVRKTAGRHPGVRIVLAHLGGTAGQPGALLGLAREHPNLWFDTCGSRHVRGCLLPLIEGGIAGRLLYGSDMPFIDPGGQLGKVLFADIPEDARKAILRENACRLFGWRN